MPVVEAITNEVKLRVYLSAIGPIMMYESETWAVESMVTEVWQNEYLYAEIDVVYRRITRGRRQHLGPPSKPTDRPCSERFAGFELEGATWKFWTEMVKEVLRTLGVDMQFRRDVRFARMWNSDEWIDSVQALAEDRGGCAELCSRTAHLGEDAGNRVK